MTSPMRTSPPVRPGLSVKLVLGLAAIGLIRPLMRISGFDLPGGQWVLTGLVTLVWVGMAGLGRVRRPVLTLLLAGLTYGLYIIPISAVVSILLTGSVQGPVALPIAIIPILVINTIWGAGAGLLALAVQNLRHTGR